MPVKNPVAKNLVRNLFYPLISLGSLSLYFLRVDPTDVKAISLLVAQITISSILIIHLFERLFPYRKSWNEPQNDRLVNFLNTVLFLPLITKVIEILLIFIFSVLISQEIREHLYNIWPSRWPIFWQFTLAVFFCEFFYYWVHRLSHRYRFLWRFHSIHHGVKRIYWDNSGFFHPVDLFLSMIFYLAPLYLFGAPPFILGGFLVLNAVTGLMEHANIDFNARGLNYIFNTAELHRWHHSTNAKISSSNFGKTISIWDLIFKTRYLPKDEHVGDVGVTTGNIPDGYWGKLKHPFRR